MLLCAERCGRVSAVRWFAAADWLTAQRGSIRVLAARRSSIWMLAARRASMATLTTLRGSIWMLAAPRRLNAMMTTLCGSILLRGELGRRFRRGGRDGRATLLCPKRRVRVTVVRRFAAANR